MLSATMTTEQVAQTSTSRALRADVQALRAIAVVSVLLFHFWPARLPGGFVGVDVFFVISGFLITGQLLRTAGRDGRVGLLEFWKRRAVRLLPSSLLVLAATALATLLWVPQDRWQQFFSEIAASTVYVENWRLAHTATDYLASTNDPSAVQHFWSLSVEEQFYVVVPLLVAATLLLGSRWRAAAGVVLVAITVGSFAYSVRDTAVDPAAAYFVTTTRAWEFGVGALLAYAAVEAPRRLRTPAAVAGVAAIVASAFLVSGETAFPGWIAAVPVVGTALVIWAHQASGTVGAVAAWRPVQVLGAVSYALYLWHWPLVVIPPMVVGHPIAWPGKLALVAVAVVLAAVTTYLFEEPIRFRIARRPGGRRAVLSSIAVAMVAVVGVSALAYASVAKRADSLREEALANVGPCFGAMAAVERGCAPARKLRPPADLIAQDEPGYPDCITNDGSAALKRCTLGPRKARVHVAAIGDSHLWALLPALDLAADDLGWRVDVMAHTGCYWSTAPRVRPTEKLVRECRDWSRSVGTHLRRAAPYDAIVVTHKEGLRVEADPGQSQTDAAAAGLLAAWRPELRRGTPIIALTDAPDFPDGTAECVAEHGLAGASRCAVAARRVTPARDSNVVAAGRTHGVSVVDLRHLIYCPWKRCRPVVGGVVMEFDDDHLTNTYATSLTPYLTDRLRRAYGRAR